MPIPDIQIQLRSKWCWAACTIYVCRFYGTHPGLSQGGLVARVLQRPVCQTNFPDPACNTMVDLEDALRFVDHFNGPPINSRLTPQEILRIINHEQALIGCQVRFPDFGHAVLIADARLNNAGVLFLSIADPGSGTINTVTYADFSSNYLQRQGRWIRTYLTR